MVQLWESLGPCSGELQYEDCQQRSSVSVTEPNRSVHLMCCKANLLTLGCGEGKHRVYWKAPSVQLLSHGWLFATLWTAACQASLSITNSQSLLQPMSIESAMPCSNLILCRPLLLLSIFPSIRVFTNESVLCIRGQSIGASASASVLSMNTQDWFLLGLPGLVSLQSKGLSRVFSNTIVQKINSSAESKGNVWSFIHFISM